MAPNPSLEPQLKRIYDLYRTSLLNSKYYSRRLNRLTSTNFLSEILIAIGATGSGIAGWAIWKDPSFGHLTWAALAASSALLAIVKPIADLGTRIKEYTELRSGYQANYIALKRICDDIETTADIEPSHIERYRVVRDRHDKLTLLDVLQPSRNVLTQIQKEVNDEIPPSSLWWPFDKSKLGKDKSPEVVVN